MPITEIPPSPPSQSSPPSFGPFRGKRSRYEDLEQEELFHVIDDLEGSKNRARIREFIWVSIIVHMIVFWYLAYGPRYFQHVRVVNPSDILKQREKELTYLDLPDALKKIKPKDSKVISDQDRTAETKKKLTIDKKTMEEMQAMRKAAPPAPAPEQQPAPQVAQQPQPQPAPPQQNTQLSQLEAPKPAPLPTNPSFNTGPATAGEAIRQAARDAAKNRSGIGGDTGGVNAPNSRPSSAGGAEILSDTMGVDFGPYMKRVIYDTERAWWPIIPEIARPPLNKQGKVMIRFKIFPDGSVKNMILEGPSGDVSLDRAAWGGITGASPYPQLPKDFKGPYLELRFYFLYNIRPGDE